MTRRFLNGETHMSNPHVPYTESIGMRREPGELKHLSSRRKRKKLFDVLSSGERKGQSPNRHACMAGFGLQIELCSIYDLQLLAERSWKDRPEMVKAQ